MKLQIVSVLTAALLPLMANAAPNPAELAARQRPIPCPVVGQYGCGGRNSGEEWTAVCGADNTVQLLENCSLKTNGCCGGIAGTTRTGCFDCGPKPSSLQNPFPPPPTPIPDWDATAPFFNAVVA